MCNIQELRRVDLGGGNKALRLLVMKYEYRYNEALGEISLVYLEGTLYP
jgi:hypothetical protein